MAGKISVIVASNRPDELDKFMDAWWTNSKFAESVGEMYVVFDGQTAPESLIEGKHSHRPITVADWDMIGRRLPVADCKVISRRDAAIKSYGVLMMKDAGDSNTAVFLDDDVRPLPNTDLTKHCSPIPRWDPLLDDVRLRGLPYLNVGKTEVVMNVGMWTNVPDLDAATQLVTPAGDYRLPTSTRVLAKGMYAPMCGMNLGFQSKAAPLAYMAPMGEGRLYRRFDDIWMGVVAKKVCDRLGWLIGYGPPHVEHIRASDPFNNLVREAPGVGTNEHFWETIDSLDLTETTPAGCLAELAEEMRSVPPPNRMQPEYWTDLADCYTIWSKFFQ